MTFASSDLYAFSQKSGRESLLPDSKTSFTHVIGNPVLIDYSEIYCSSAEYHGTDLTTSGPQTDVFTQTNQAEDPALAFPHAVELDP